MANQTLNAHVTSAIWLAEELQARGLASASQAWAEVSAVEEELASALAPSDAEGRIARRGAVRAAIRAGDYARAKSLYDRYVQEDGAPKALKTALKQILAEDAKPMEKA